MDTGGLAREGLALAVAAGRVQSERVAFQDTDGDKIEFWRDDQGLHYDVNGQTKVRCIEWVQTTNGKASEPGH